MSIVHDERPTHSAETRFCAAFESHAGFGTKSRSSKSARPFAAWLLQQGPAMIVFAFPTFTTRASVWKQYFPRISGD